MLTFLKAQLDLISILRMTTRGLIDIIWSTIFWKSKICVGWILQPDLLISTHVLKRYWQNNCNSHPFSEDYLGFENCVFERVGLIVTGNDKLLYFQHETPCKACVSLRDGYTPLLTLFFCSILSSLFHKIQLQRGLRMILHIHFNCYTVIILVLYQLNFIHKHFKLNFNKICCRIVLEIIDQI